MAEETKKLDSSAVAQRVYGAISVATKDIEDDAMIMEAVIWYAIDSFARDPQLAAKLNPQIWGMIGAYSGGSMDSALVNRLHREHKHPDYEYQCIESGRKQGDGRAPEGYGWETNWLFYGEEAPESLRGTKYEDHDRDDFTDTAWWRRLKTDAAHDEVDPFDSSRPKVTLKPVKLYDVLKMVAEYVNPGYFPAPVQPNAPGMPSLPRATETLTSAAYMTNVQICCAAIDSMTAPGKVGRPEFNSKPNYIEGRNFLKNLEQGANVYQPGGSFMGAEDDVIVTYNAEVTHRAQRDVIYFYVELEEADILINLNKPFTESFIRVNLKGVKERGEFRNWPHFAEVAVNPYTLREAIEQQAG
jgi:hypothetical protein